MATLATATATTTRTRVSQTVPRRFRPGRRPLSYAVLPPVYPPGHFCPTGPYPGRRCSTTWANRPETGSEPAGRLLSQAKRETQDEVDELLGSSPRPIPRLTIARAAWIWDRPSGRPPTPPSRSVLMSGTGSPRRRVMPGTSRRHRVLRQGWRSTLPSVRRGQRSASGPTVIRPPGAQLSGLAVECRTFGRNCKQAFHGGMTARRVALCMDGPLRPTRRTRLPSPSPRLCPTSAVVLGADRPAGSARRLLPAARAPSDRVLPPFSLLTGGFL